MPYDYGTIKYFIEDSNKLLRMLEEKGLWNKDTLVIGLDKSVRPLAYTLRKLSKLEGKELPDMKFFNYSHFDYILSNDSTNRKIAAYMKHKLNPKKLNNYNKILVLDEYVSRGYTFKETKNILNYYLKHLKKKPDIFFASLNIDRDRMGQNFKEYLINSNYKTNIGGRSETETGIEDQIVYYRPFLRKKQRIAESKKVSDSKIYAKFLAHRGQLSQDIKDYVRENNLEGENVRTGKLEKAVQVASIMALLGGFIFGYQGITGNVIGSVSSSNVVGIALIIFGILGLVFSQINRRK